MSILVVDPTFFPHMLAAQFDSADYEMTTIGHRERGDIPSALWHYSMGLIFYPTDLLLGFFWLSQNCVGMFC